MPEPPLVVALDEELVDEEDEDEVDVDVGVEV